MQVIKNQSKIKLKLERLRIAALDYIQRKVIWHTVQYEETAWQRGTSCFLGLILTLLEVLPEADGNLPVCDTWSKQTNCSSTSSSDRAHTQRN